MINFLRHLTWVYRPLYSNRSRLHEETQLLLDEKSRELFHRRLEKLAIEADISRLEKQLSFIRKQLDVTTTILGGEMGATIPPSHDN